MSNGSVIDKLTSIFQNLVAPNSSLQSNKPQSSTLQTSPDRTGTGYNALFHGADKFPLASMERIQTKKIWEKPIGAKYNVNDEVNHIAQQRQLNQIGLQELRAMYSRQFNGEKPSW